MTDTNSRENSEHSATTSSHQRLGIYEVEKYRPDGWYSWPKLMQLCGGLGAAGIVLGGVAAFISQYFWLLILFPVLIGFAMGWAGDKLVNRFHIRNPWICAVGGLCAGVFAMLAMHFTNFRLHEAELSKHIDPAVIAIGRNITALEQQGAEVPEEIRQLMRELRAEPLLLAAIQVDTFPKFIDYKAREGIELRSRRARDGANLGFTGTWIYWGLEVFLVAGITLAMMKKSAEMPYCTSNQAWKSPLVLGPFIHSQELLEEWKRGELRPMTFAESTEQPMLLVTIYLSPGLESETPSDVFLEKLTYDKSNNAKQKSLAKLTYPPEAYQDLLTACGVSLDGAEQTSTDESAPVENT